MKSSEIDFCIFSPSQGLPLFSESVSGSKNISSIDFHRALWKDLQDIQLEQQRRTHRTQPLTLSISVDQH